MRNYELKVQESFSSAHHLKGYAGNCARQHGHNWLITVTIHASQLDEVGIAIDFKKLRGILKETVSPLDHAYLNDLPAFADQNPTAENIAAYLYGLIKPKVESESCSLLRVTVEESPGKEASYWES